MTIKKEWKKHMAAVLVAVEKSTEPGAMSKKEALGFMALLIEEVEVRQDALVEELEDSTALRIKSISVTGAKATDVRVGEG